MIEKVFKVFIEGKGHSSDRTSLLLHNGLIENYLNTAEDYFLRNKRMENMNLIPNLYISDPNIWP